MTCDLRLLIIGIDGADHQRVRDYMADGTMPNLGALAREGAFGLLRSVIPPVTPAAWTTITTGRNPGKHGLYEFRQVACGQTHYALADRRRTPTLFHALNRHGLAVGLYNVPWTYPPDRYDGFVVAGMDALRLHPEMAWPPQAFDVLTRLAGDDYEPWPSVGPGFRLDAAKVMRYLDLRVALSRQLLARFPADAYMVVFNMVDFVQHIFMGRRIADTLDGARMEDPVRWVYARADEALGRLLNDLRGSDTVVCVVSDHGMTRADRLVNMEKLFADRGWLVPAGGQVAAAAWRGALRLWRLARGLIPAPVREALRRPVRQCLAAAHSHGHAHTPVDWSRTRAVPFGTHGCVRICCAGRDPCGTVPQQRYAALREEIASALRELRFPTDGQPVFEAVRTREDLYHGPALDDAPDLVAVPTDFRYWLAAGRGGKPIPGLLAQAETLAELDPPTGVHRPTGILLLAGPGVEAGQVCNADLVDVAPTLLHLLGLPIPDDMDGRPLLQAMSRELRTRPVRTEAEPLLTPRPHRAMTEQEQRELEGRLRDLGYL